RVWGIDCWCRAHADWRLSAGPRHYPDRAHRGHRAPFPPPACAHGYIRHARCRRGDRGARSRGSRRILLSEQKRITLVLGGARSGKSRYAEKLITASPPPWIYVATAQAGDAE